MTKAGTNYYSPTPLDFALLGLLPDQGVLGGVHWAGRPVRHLTDELNAQLPEGTPPLDHNAVIARLRSMKVAGYVADYRATGGRIWARTPEGVVHLGRREEVLGL